MTMLMRRPRIELAVLSLALAAASPHAQTQTPPPRAAGVVQAETTAVLVDVVVRDRRGQPVTDLGAEDFEVYEDGVLQEIGAITLYTPDGGSRPPSRSAGPAAPDAATATAAPAPSTATAAPQDPVVALVFDRLTPVARVFAH